MSWFGALLRVWSLAERVADLMRPPRPREPSPPEPPPDVPGPVAAAALEVARAVASGDRARVEAVCGPGLAAGEILAMVSVYDDVRAPTPADPWILGALEAADGTFEVEGARMEGDARGDLVLLISVQDGVARLLDAHP